MQSTTGMAQRGIAEAQSSGVSGVPAGTVDAVPVRALLLGERLDTRTLERDKPLGIAPLTVAIPDGGVAVLFRYGAIVLFGGETVAMDNFVASLSASIAGAFPVPERDKARLLVRPESEQPIDASGNIVVQKRTTEGLQLVANILAKSLILSHYETRIANIFQPGADPQQHARRMVYRIADHRRAVADHLSFGSPPIEARPADWRPGSREAGLQPPTQPR